MFTFLYFTFTLFMGWYDFAVSLLFLPGRCSLPLGWYFCFSPDFETFCCFLVFCQELYLPCSGFRISSGYYFAVRIFASVWLFLWILLRRSHFASVWLSFSFLRCFSAFLEFCFVFGLFSAVRVSASVWPSLASSGYSGVFPGYSVIWSVCLPWIF